jgi:hypothetical protein
MPASGANGPKQTNGYFVVTSTLVSTLVLVQGVAPGGSGGSYLPGTLVSCGATASAWPAGTLLKDMGKTVVSSTHTFRKVQPVMPNGPYTATAAPMSGAPFYVELNEDQSRESAAPQLAYTPGLM